MTEAIIWLVVWLVLAFAGAWLAIVLGTLGGVGLAALTDRVWFAPLGMIIGWLIGIGWFIFAAVHVILQIISVIELASA